MLSSGDDDAARLGRFVYERRVYLRLSQSEAAKRAHVSRRTWDRIETGTGKAYAVSYAAIEEVLGWAAGTCRAILVGGDPVEATPAGTTTEADDLVARIEASRYPQATKDILIAAVRVAEATERDRSLHANSA